MEHLTPIVVAGVVPAVVIVVLRYLMNSRQDQAAPAEQGCVVQYGKTFKAFVVILTLVAGALVSVVLVVGLAAAPKGWPVAIGVAAFFALLLVPLYLEFFRVRIIVTEEGLQCRSGWRPKREVRWDEIKSVDFSATLQWYRMHTEGKGIVRLHVFLSGLQSLFDALKHHTDIEVEQPSTPW